MTDRSDSPEAPSSDAGDVPFEQALGRLEEIVARLERGDLELEAALSAFEEGVSLSRSCADRIEQAERRIEALVEKGKEWIARPLEGEGGSG